MSAYKRGKDMKKINVLSIDGGGIRGIIPAMVLAEIEKRTGKRICELFDIIAGTSTGGILALALTKPKSGSNEPEFTASELIGLYENEGHKIFPKSIWGAVRQLRGAKYQEDGLVKLLKDKFGDARLKEALTRVIITSYDLETRKSWFFKSEKARNVPLDEYDYPMADVARATSAAPTYFRPAKIKGKQWDKAKEKLIDNIERVLIDGGVQANNPAMCAYAEAVDLNSDAQICVVSLGTGEVPIENRGEEGEKWGEKADTWSLIGWGKPVIQMTMDGPGDTVHFQLKQMNRRGDNNYYYRLQASLTEDCEELDSIDPKNIEKLKGFAETMIKDADNADIKKSEGKLKNIGEACERLMKNKGYPLTGLNFYPYRDLATQPS